MKRCSLERAFASDFSVPPNCTKTTLGWSIDALRVDSVYSQCVKHLNNAAVFRWFLSENVACYQLSVLTNVYRHLVALEKESAVEKETGSISSALNKGWRRLWKLHQAQTVTHCTGVAASQ